MLQPLSVVAVPTVLTLAFAVAPGQWNSPRAGDSPARIATATNHEATCITAFVPQTRDTRWVVATTGNEARYRVREQLAGVEFPSDAVGKTSQVTGAIVIGADGQIIREGSSFTVDLASIQSDNQRRDGYVRRNTLQTDSFPKAVFVPTLAQGLPAARPATGDIAFQLTGELTIHGVTRPATWQVKATRTASGAVSGTATTNFKFGDFGMRIPRVGRVLSVDDSITLEYDFTLAPQAP